MTDPADVMAELTPSQRTRLVRHAVRTSRKAGYCDEVVHILNLMGFRVPVFRNDEEIEKYDAEGTT